LGDGIGPEYRKRLHFRRMLQNRWGVRIIGKAQSRVPVDLQSYWRDTISIVRGKERQCELGNMRETSKTDRPSEGGFQGGALKGRI